MESGYYKRRRELSSRELKVKLARARGESPPLLPRPAKPPREPQPPTEKTALDGSRYWDYWKFVGTSKGGTWKRQIYEFQVYAQLDYLKDWQKWARAELAKEERAPAPPSAPQGGAE